MDATVKAAEIERTGALAPLAERTFRTIWLASLFSNFGQLILGVGAAWQMTRLTASTSMVALVQTALMLPLMLVAVPAGALADMFDHRKIAMVGLAFAIVCSASLTTLTALGYGSPWLLLGFCGLIGAGVALFSPAWQASIREQVTPQHLPAAVALGSISYNVARSVGPAIGGIIVATAGAQAAFGVNAACYVPIFAAFLFWRRQYVPARLPPEQIHRAIVSGVRYAIHSPPIRTVLVRASLFGLTGASYSALAVLIARDLLHGGASTFGLLLGASGVGAVIGAACIAPLRARFGPERCAQLFAVLSGVAIVAIGISRWVPLSCAGFFLAGGANIMAIGLYNITVQLSAPRWVTARALSLFSSALTGGIAVGAIIWGRIASQWGVAHALQISGMSLFVTLFAGLALPLPKASHDEHQPVEIGSDPETALGLNLRSGPMAIEVDYRVDPANARRFYDAMRAIRKVRLRNGGFGWSLARDVADPFLWTERYECPTWGDYLRVRDRFTQADRDAQGMVDGLLESDSAKTVRRRLVRPFGSVRWQEDTPDAHAPIDTLAP